jgi:hypothetical protein
MLGGNTTFLYSGSFNQTALQLPSGVSQVAVYTDSGTVDANSVPDVGIRHCQV